MRRAALLSALLVSLGLALACGGGGDEPSTPDGGKKRKKARAGADAPPDPLAGRSKAEICRDSSLALIRYDLDTLQRDFAGTCCGGDGLPADDMECNLDWPFSDVPPCEEWARMRNGIYARYGYPFEGARWRAEFEALPWYQRREDFDPSWMPATARKNVDRLKKNEEQKVACSP